METTEKFVVDFLDRIQRINVISETEHYVTFEQKRWDGKMGTNRRKKGHDFAVFLTFTEAKEHKLAILRGKIDSYKTQVANYSSELDQTEKFTEDQCSSASSSAL